MTIQKLHERVRQIEERRAVIAWEYRQRNLSKGVWFRLRRALAGAKEAYAVDDRDAEELIARGCVPLDVGRQLSPEKRIYVLTREEVLPLSSARPVRLHLDGELLAARNLVLVPFDGTSGASR